MNTATRRNRIAPFFHGEEGRERRLFFRGVMKAMVLERMMKDCYTHLARNAGNTGIGTTAEAFVTHCGAGMEAMAEFLARRTGGVISEPEAGHRHFVGLEEHSVTGMLDRMLDLCAQRMDLYYRLIRMARVEERSLFRDLVIKSRNEIHFLRQEQQSRSQLPYSRIAGSGSFYSLMTAAAAWKKV